MSKLRQFYVNSGFLNSLRYLITPLMVRINDGLLFDDSSFYRINLNCRGDAYYGYVNIEDTRTKARVFVSALDSLPFENMKVKFIIVDLAAIDMKKYDPARMSREWARVMVPNGVLTIDNCSRDDELVKFLKEAEFELLFDDSANLLPVCHFIYNPDIALRNKVGLEYMRPKAAFDFLVRLHSQMKPEEIRKLTIKNEVLQEAESCLCFFDKANLALVLDKIGFFIENIEIKEGNIQAQIRKKPAIFEPALKIEKKKRICALEQYLMFRYSRLGFDEDGLPSAAEKLGYDCLPVEAMRNVDPRVLQKAILAYRPDYIVLRLKEVLPLLYDIKSDLRKLGTKVMFWFTDPTHPEPDTDLSEVVDVMFLSNRGQLEEYKKAYKLERVYFMAQSYMPNAFHHVDLPEIFDIAFTGALSRDPLHSTRRQILERLSQKYRVEIRNNVRNNLAEFYSQSKFVFGSSNFPYDCYTSNRFFAAMGCGSVYLSPKFSGIELFARNKEHLLWFEDYPEMFDLIDFYLKDDLQRRKIGENAQRLAQSRHTTVHRLRNMIDILEGKTEKFYGFLE